MVTICSRLGLRLVFWEQGSQRVHRQFFSSWNHKKQEQLSLRLYRVLQHHVRDVDWNDDDDASSHCRMMLLQTPLDPRQLGQARMLNSTNDHHTDKTLPSQEDETTNSILHFFQMQSSNSSINNYTKEDDDDSLLWVSSMDLKRALRQAFTKSTSSTMTMTSDKQIWQQKQKEAIDAIRIWTEQIYMWKHCTTVTTNETYGIRVIATSRYVGIGGSSHNKKSPNHHFAYKIRIQSLRSPVENDDTLVVQLLGRTWHIKETPSTTTTATTTLFNQTGEEDEDNEPYKQVVSIDASTTGAVGHLPVIRPGETFEYISKCELSTEKGLMEGYFHMALVPQSTQSAQVGDPIDALLEEDDDDKFFKVPVGPFSLNIQHGP